LCITKYLEFSESVFRLDKNILAIPVGKNKCYFDEKPLEEALKKVIREQTENENTPLADDGDPTCPVFVVTAFGRIADGPLKLFKSYGVDKDATPIWQAARATTAAPVFFPPARVTIPEPTGLYIDGGVRANNPSWEALREGKKHWRTRKCFVVSIGTGVQKPVNFIGKTKAGNTTHTGRANIQSEQLETEPTTKPAPGDEVQKADLKQRSKTLLDGLKQGLKTTFQPLSEKAAQIIRIPAGVQVASNILKAIVDLSTSSENTHGQVWRDANSEDEGAQFPYFRFNVLRGMDEIGLEEWKMKEAVADLTRSYLELPDVEQDLRKCAEGMHNPTAFEST
jgi:predicted acylesterase/phospholipase RssA